MFSRSDPVLTLFGVYKSAPFLKVPLWGFLKIFLADGRGKLKKPSGEFFPPLVVVPKTQRG